MSLSRAAIVDQLKETVGTDRVITDETVLKKNSVDHFRKFPGIHSIYTLLIPAVAIKFNSTEQISCVLNFTNAHRINGVSRTGASVTKDGLRTIVENSMVLDGFAMNQIINIDTENMQATTQRGVPLEVLESAPCEKGCVTGHSSQSRPLAQMDGLIATRSTRQFSTFYGAVEGMVVGLEVVLADDTVVRIKNIPHHAIDPNIRHIIVSNEGALCCITKVIVKIFRFILESNLPCGYILEDMKIGFNTLRGVMVEGHRPPIVRLYNAENSTQHSIHFADGKCVLIFMAEDSPRIVRAASEGITEVVARYPQCQRVDSKLIEAWSNNLNWGSDKVAAECARILKTDSMGFIIGVSNCRSCTHEIYESVINHTRTESPRTDDITMLGGHSSHNYRSNTNMYFVYGYNVVDCKPEEEIDKHHDPLNKIIYEETVRLGGLMVCRHGIGKYHVHWSKLEHDNAQVLLEGLKEQFDSNGIMNTGTIYPIEK